jgi:glutathione S-transferase
MRLYFSPGACSLSPHIVARELGLELSLEKVDTRAKKLSDGRDYWAINPKGYVPALGLDDGQVLTEGAVIVQYIADQKPESKLAPKAGTLSRVRLQEWLHFIATELHKGFGPINNPKSTPELKQFFRQRLDARFQILASALQNNEFLLDNAFSVADGYAFYTLRNLRKLDAAAVDQSPVLKAYYDRIAARPAVRASLEAEGLQ